MSINLEQALSALPPEALQELRDPSSHDDEWSKRRDRFWKTCVMEHFVKEFGLPLNCWGRLCVDGDSAWIEAGWLSKLLLLTCAMLTAECTAAYFWR